MKRFVVTIEGGNMTIRKGRTLASVKRRALRELGTDSNPSVKEATQEDVDWYLAMGGNSDNT